LLLSSILESVELSKLIELLFVFNTSIVFPLVSEAILLDLFSDSKFVLLLSVLIVMSSLIILSVLFVSSVLILFSVLAVLISSKQLYVTISFGISISLIAMLKDKF